MALIDKDRISELFKDTEDSQNKRRSLVITTTIVASLTLLFTIFGFVTPLPLPAEEGSFVLVGYEDGEEEITEPIEEPQEEMEEDVEEPQEEQPEPVNEEVSETEMETADEPDAPEVEAAEEPTEQPTETETPTEEPEEPVEEPDNTLNNDLANLLKSKPKPKGEETENEREIGEVGFTYKNTAFGSVGIVGGEGVEILDIPGIDEKTQENGTVFIEVTINADNSISAKVDYSKSTTTNTSLINKALASAKKGTYKRTNNKLISTVTVKFEYRLK
jgi:type IV secretory pathway VirB10-like protein